MPAGKQTAITLTFSKKNMDAYEKIQASTKNTGISQTDYICNAIRAYGESVNSNTNVDMKLVEKIVNEKLERFKNEVLKNELQDQEFKKHKNSYLEEINIDLPLGDD